MCYKIDIGIDDATLRTIPSILSVGLGLRLYSANYWSCGLADVLDRCLFGGESRAVGFG